MHDAVYLEGTKMLEEPTTSIFRVEAFLCGIFLPIQRTIWCQIPVDHNLYIHYHENNKS
jgi:hypothetical protein